MRGVLPCMDNDDMRRGRPTVHRVFGSRTAILAGVAMIPLAIRVVREAARAMSLSAGVERALAETLAAAAGDFGMIGGQLRELGGGGSALTLDDLQTGNMAKTAALVVVSVRVGAMAAGAAASGPAPIEP